MQETTRDRDLLMSESTLDGAFRNIGEVATFTHPLTTARRTPDGGRGQ